MDALTKAAAEAAKASAEEGGTAHVNVEEVFSEDDGKEELTEARILSPKSYEKNEKFQRQKRKTFKN